MSIKHVWSVLCRRVVIDNHSNNLSLFDVFEQISLTVKKTGATDGGPNQSPDKLISVPFDYTLVSLWTKANSDKPAKANVKLELLDPNNKQLNEETFKIEIVDGSKRLRNTIQIQNLVLTKSGIYNFRVSVKNADDEKYTAVANLPLEVNMQTE